MFLIIITYSTGSLAVTVYFNHFNIRTTSPLPHGGDVSTRYDQIFLLGRGEIIRISKIFNY